MKPGAILINSSRGEVVDGEALPGAVSAGRFDVWEHEPHLDPALLETRCTPHRGLLPEQGKANATAMSVALAGPPACRSKGGIRPRLLRRAGDRSPGRNFAGPSAGRTTSQSESRSP